MINKSPSAYLSSHDAGRLPGIFPRARARAVKYTGVIIDKPDVTRKGADMKLMTWPLPPAGETNIVDYGLITDPVGVVIDYGHIHQPVAKVHDYEHIT